MCVSVYVFGKELRRCETAGELAKALGIRVRALPTMSYITGEWRIRWNDCLCHIDVEKLAEGKGLVCEPPAYDEDTDHFDGWALREKKSERRS